MSWITSAKNVIFFIETIINNECINLCKDCSRVVWLVQLLHVMDFNVSYKQNYVIFLSHDGCCFHRYCLTP